MKIGFASNSSKAGLKALWRAAFHDPEEYIDLFLERRFRPEQTLCAFDGARPVSMVFLLPLEVTSGERRYPAQYLYGVATDRDYRARGLSGALIERAQQTLSERGGALSMLVPAGEGLFSFYRKRGFETEFSISHAAYRAGSGPAGPSLSLTEASLAELESVRNRAFSAARLFGRWDRAALRYQDQETALLGGGVFRFETEDGEGYAVCVPAGTRLLVKELVLPPGADSGFRTAVFGALLRRFGRTELTAAVWAGEDAVPFAMTRWNPNVPKITTGEAKPYFSLVLD